MSHLIDLHIHTTASDGTYTPHELVKQIQHHHISTFAITDHDTISNIQETSILTQDLPLHFIPGVEISTTFNHKEYHILTYQLDLKNEALCAIIEKNRNIRLNYHAHVIQTLEHLYPSLSSKEFEAYTYAPFRGGWRSLNYLLDKKVVQNLYEYFTLMKTHQLELVFDPPTSLIASIRKAGGLPILAHPPAYQNDKMPLFELKSWLEFGIQGLECYSPYYKEPFDQNYYLEFCNHNNLYITGGSDCHGTFLTTRKLLNPQIDKSMLKLPF